MIAESHDPYEKQAGEPEARIGPQYSNTCRNKSPAKCGTGFIPGHKSYMPSSLYPGYLICHQQEGPVNLCGSDFSGRPASSNFYPREIKNSARYIHGKYELHDNHNTM